MLNPHPPHMAEFTVDNTVVQIPTDDEALAALLSSSHSEDDHDLINAVKPSAAQHKQTGSDLRQRNKATGSAQTSISDKPASPGQLARLIKDSPFIDTQSPMTAFEAFKIITLLPWTLFRIIVATPCALLVWLSVALLVWGHPINAPLPRWRRNFLHYWLRSAVSTASLPAHLNQECCCNWTLARSTRHLKTPLPSQQGYDCYAPPKM